MVVVDEVDTMLSQGFGADLEKILKATKRIAKSRAKAEGGDAKPAAEPSRTMPSRAARKAAIVDGEEGDFEEEEEEELAIAGNEMVTPGVAKLVSYGIRTEVPMLELPAPPDWDAGVSDDEAAAKDDADAEEDDESNSDLEIAVTTTKKKKPLGARNTAVAAAAPGGKHGAGKRRKEARTKENASDPYDDAVLDEPAAKAART